jgi:palmitoyltransferase
VGGFGVYVKVGFDRYMPGPYIGDVHKTTGTIIMLLCYASFIVAVQSDPGIITKANLHQALRRYEYDDIMFFKKNECKTCKFVKPARSKHCALCNVCVEKFDHHCIWINNCVGRNNYRWFITFVLMHAVISLYGAVCGVLIFSGIIKQQRLWEQKFHMVSTGEQIETNLYVILRYLFYSETAFAFVTILCICMGIMLLCFGLHHLRLAMNNVTTNESYKRSAFMSWFEEKLDFIEQWK